MKIIIYLEDDSNEFFKMVKKIKEHSKDGHSFRVVVGPCDNDFTERFGIDGSVKGAIQRQFDFFVSCGV